MFYLIDKKKALPLSKLLETLQKEKGIKKIGHTGTLDPLATGLLLVATDEDTRLIDYIDKGFKSYKATMKLGQTSSTYDIEGEISKMKDFNVDHDKAIKTLKSFEGTYEQMPPIFSAKRVNGKRAYELAREGKEVKLKPSTVTIKSIYDIKFIDEKTIEFNVEVSRGTYIRSLIHDFGQKQGCGALMSKLRRTTIGALDETMCNAPIHVNDLLTIPILSTSKMKELINGKNVQTKEKPGIYALDYKGDIFGIVEVVKNYIKPKKLMGNKFRKAGF